MWRGGLHDSSAMPTNCPNCGNQMEFEEREVRLRTGTCPTCSKEYAFVEGESVASRLGSAAAAAASDEGEGAEETAATVGGPECEECGSPLTFREGANGTLEVSCEECETMAVFVPQAEAAAPTRARSEGRRPPREFDSGPPRGRPCRKCGNPIQLSTREDGMVVGECSSCGNRFTLPPRREGYGGGRRFDRGSRDDRRDFRRGPGDRRGSGYRGSNRGPPSRYDDRTRRRKRRPPEDE